MPKDRCQQLLQAFIGCVMQSEALKETSKVRCECLRASTAAHQLFELKLDDDRVQ